MPLYDYRCECEQRVLNVEQGMSDPHVYLCPRCGNEMAQDFSDYQPPRIMGDLPTTSWLAGGYFDSQLNAYIESSGQRKDLMERQGLEDFSMEPEQSGMHQEAEYIRKHAPKREAGGAINMLAEETRAKMDGRYVDSVIDPVIDKAVGSLSD
jgi:putative FmdB family regulatory protein